MENLDRLRCQATIKNAEIFRLFLTARPSFLFAHGFFLLGKWYVSSNYGTGMPPVLAMTRYTYIARGLFVFSVLG